MLSSLLDEASTLFRCSRETTICNTCLPPLERGARVKKSLTTEAETAAEELLK